MECGITRTPRINLRSDLCGDKYKATGMMVQVQAVPFFWPKHLSLGPWHPGQGPQELLLPSALFAEPKV